MRNKHQWLDIVFSLFIAVAICFMCSAPVAAQTNTKLIALTFDDGPSAYTAKFLNGLMDRNAHVTFFLKGDHLLRYGAVAERAAMEGHELGNHTKNHLDLCTLDEETLLSEILENEKLITKVSGKDHFLVRPPYGSYNKTVLSIVNRPVIHWTVDTYDWSIKNAETLTAQLVAKAGDGKIFLMHDTVATTPKGVLDAIDILQAQGYSFVTVSELYRRKGLSLEDYCLYYAAPANGVDFGGSSSRNPYDFDEAKLNQHWAIDNIRYVEKNGLMQGTGENEFRPNYPMTRAMFVCVLARMAKADTSAYENPFLDVKNGQWYTQAIAWAAANNIVGGTGGNCFSPGENISKEEICTILHRFAVMNEVVFAGEQEKAFVDGDTISAWAQEGVAAMTSVGIINGRESRLGLAFDPQKYATRAETSVIIANYTKYQQEEQKEQEKEDES